MAGMVLLRHTPPDASSHYDWMLERDAPEEHRLVAFRVDRRLDELAAAEHPDPFEAERIGDHRARYLTFEGPIRPKLGRVDRIARGEATIERDEPERFEASIRFEGGPARRAIGTPTTAGWWRFTLAPDA